MMIDKEVISILGINSLPFSKQNEIVSRIENIILNKLSSRIINKLSPENRKKYIEILDFGKSEDIYKFLSSKIPNFKDLISEISIEIVNEFRKELVLK